jgi:hypothetical protein
MPNCDRCNKPIQGKTLYSDPIIMGKIVCKSCFNLACDEVGRIDLMEK